jgi:hypothetical protein
MQKFKEQLPALLVIAVLLVGTAAWTLNRLAAREDSALLPLHDENQALKAQVDDARHQLEATNLLLRETIARGNATDVEAQNLDNRRMDALADAIARKVVPAIPGPKTPEEAVRMRNEELDEVSTLTAQKIGPMLDRMNQGQVSAQQTIAQDQEKIQTLDNCLQATQAAAQNAVSLSNQISSLYLDSVNNQGVLVRVADLPADIIKDAFTGHFITGDRKRAEEDLNRKLDQIEKQLNAIQEQADRS